MTRYRALVTGAGKGLGLHLATRLADDGWSVWAVIRPDAEAPPSPSGVSYLRADLSSSEALSILSSRIPGNLDLAVHCAVTYPTGTESGPGLEDMEDAFRVNALMPYLLTLDVMRRQAPGHFCSHIMVNSEAMYAADHHSAVYAASKAALRVLTSGLAGGCRSGGASVATLLLGPLADTGKLAEAQAIAERKGLSRDDVVRLFLRRSNRNLVIDRFIDYESCYRSVQYIRGLGPTANGMVCKLDGGSSGSLI